MDRRSRRLAVLQKRNAELMKVAATKGQAKLQELRKNYRKTDPYVHLTRSERMSFLREIANLIGSWGNARLFAEAIDKRVLASAPPKTPPREAAFTQVVTRFQHFLRN